MYIHKIPNRNSPPAILLREGYKEDGKVKNRTIANLSKLPPDIIEGLKLLLKGGVTLENIADIKVIESLPHGHVACLLEKCKQIGLDKIIYSRKSKNLSLALCMILGRLLFPSSKLSLLRNMRNSTLANELSLDSSITEKDFYKCLDWLYDNQGRIEKKLASKHLEDGKLILYDISSAYVEGEKCPIAKRGYSRDNRPDKLQIVFGLICTKEGCPVSIKVFEGNTVDSTTVKTLVDSLVSKYSLSDVVIAGDRGMFCNKNIQEDFTDKPISWIGALKKSQIIKLHNINAIELDSIPDNEYKEITTELFPGERIIVCKNPLVTAKSMAQRTSILESIVDKLKDIEVATKREKNPLRGKDEIGLRIGKVIKQKQKWFEFDIKEDRFSFTIKERQIEKESLMDGIYAIRTSLPKSKGKAEQILEYYKSLSKVEDAFRCIKTTDIKLRPIYHRNENRVKAHVFVCMLAYYLQWHIRKDWKNLLFDDENPQRESIIKPSKPSEEAKIKYATKKNPGGLPLSSFSDLIHNLSGVHQIKLKLPIGKDLIVSRYSELKPSQKTAIKQVSSKLLAVIES